MALFRMDPFLLFDNFTKILKISEKNRSMAESGPVPIPGSGRSVFAFLPGGAFWNSGQNCAKSSSIALLGFCHLLTYFALKTLR